MSTGPVNVLATQTEPLVLTAQNKEGATISLEAGSTVNYTIDNSSIATVAVAPNGVDAVVTPVVGGPGGVVNVFATVTRPNGTVLTSNTVTLTIGAGVDAVPVTLTLTPGTPS